MNASRLLVALLVLSLSCRTKSDQKDSTATTSQPDSATLLAKRPGSDAPRSAADRLVRALYFEHNKTENPFREKNRALIDQFFAQPTADLIWDDAQKSVGKMKQAGRNPLFNAPDKVIRKTWVEAAAIGGSRAVVYVTFNNNTKPEEIRIDLQQKDKRWRITDLLYPDGTRLTQQLRP